MVTRKSKSTHVTLADVARASGFSTSTVSIVLNEAPLSRYVAVKTKELIRKKASEMGYHPDALARSLSRRHSQTIGVLVFDISDPFCMSLLRGIERTLYPTPYLPIIMDADNRPEQFDRYLDMLIGRRVEGLILVANWLFAEIDPLSKIEKNKIPMTVVGRDLTPRSIRSVVVDNEAGGYAAIEHLYLLGHRRIAFLRGPKEMDDSSRRWQGIRRFASKVRLRLDPRLTFQLPSLMDPASGFEGGLRLTTELIKTMIDFSAILAFDDLTALGAIRALWLAGRRVPHDCSVIGFDDVPHAALTSPAITTIHQPMLEMGSLAANLVLDAVTVPSRGSFKAGLLHLLPPELIRRESTQNLVQHHNPSKSS
ncbi:MAG: LacI family DNA-binding transcriptional regulator [Terracidiphilus sp.]